MQGFNVSDYFVDRHVREGRGDRVAIRVRGESITYEELAGRVATAAAALADVGVRSEERVLMVLFDGADFVSVFLGAMRLGAVPLPLNPLLPGADLARVALESRARVGAIAAERADVAPILAAGAPELVELLVAGDAAAEISLVRLADVMAASSAAPAYDTWEESPGFWLCTSGTTGRAKLVMHRHVDLRLTAEGYAQEVLAVDPDDRCYSVAPMFHAYGLGNSMGFPLSVGATAVVEPRRPPSPELAASVLRSERPTLFFAVPTFYAALLASDLPADTFGSTRLAVSAGEPLPAELCAQFEHRFGVEVLDGIGSTELTHIYISNRAGAVRPGSSGTPVAGYRVRLEDEHGAPVASDTPGQLVAAGQALATGYWCRTDATRERFQGEWLRTGDMYACAADGFYTYLGRTDDMLKVAGEWVSPAEVEAVLVEHPTVLEAAVVGVPTPDGLTKPAAMVVAAPGLDPDPAELMEHCRSRLAGFKRPRAIFVVDTLPKTAVGKIVRSNVRELAAAASARAGQGVTG
jgi:benzoate-CoA ligase family protein